MNTSSFDSRRLGRLSLALALAVSLSGALTLVSPPAQAMQAPLRALSAPGSAQLTPAGEQWLRGQAAQGLAQPQALIIVTLPGEGTTVQERRTMTLRATLSALGLPPRQIYVEAGGSQR